MHIAVFLQYYHTPDCPTGARPFSLVERLARDHQVTVVTTRSWHDRRLSHDFPWAPAGVDLRMLDVPYRNAMGPGARLRAYAHYAGRAFLEGLRIPRPDLIIGSSTPLTAALSAALVAQARGAPWIFEVRDLWPAFPIQMGALSNPLLIAVLRAVERSLYRSAAHVIALSPDMDAHIRRVAPAARVSTVEYGTDLDLVQQVKGEDVRALRTEYDLPPTGVVLYAGTFGRANAIPTLVRAARQLRHRSDICFVFAGHGYHAPLIERAQRTLPNVRRVPPQPRRRTLALFRCAATSITSFADRPVLGTNSPSKLYDSLAMGTPVIVTNPGWMQRLVNEHACGWYVPPEAPARLAHKLAALFDDPPALREAGDRAEVLARARFNRAAHMDRIAQLVAGATAPRRDGHR